MNYTEWLVDFRRDDDPRAGPLDSTVDRRVGQAVFCGVETGYCGSWSDAVDFELDTDADLNAVVVVNDGVIIATADGQVIHASSDPSLAELSQDVEYSVEVPLNAVTAWQGQVWTVGDDGTVLQKAGDGDWEIVDLGTHARLHDVAAVGLGTGWLVIVGDNASSFGPLLVAGLLSEECSYPRRSTR